MRRLAHTGKHPVGHMLRSHLQLAADVVFYQFPEKPVVFVVNQVIKADTGTDKDFFYSGQGTQLPKKSQIIGVIDLQILAGRRKQALVCRARAAFGVLFFTGRLPEVRRWPSIVQVVALNMRIFSK